MNRDTNEFNRIQNCYSVVAGACAGEHQGRVERCGAKVRISQQMEEDSQIVHRHFRIWTSMFLAVRSSLRQLRATHNSHNNSTQQSISVYPLNAVEDKFWFDIIIVWQSVPTSLDFVNVNINTNIKPAIIIMIILIPANRMIIIISGTSTCQA